MVLLMALSFSELKAATPVLTRSFDDTRTGANTSETVFTPANVAPGLKKIFSLDIPDDPRLEAQPLYVPGITMSDNQKHDVLYVFSMANTVWAFDANTGQPIWQKPAQVGEPYQQARFP
jgi:outer membrane protein assembly factor BamB